MPSSAGADSSARADSSAGSSWEAAVVSVVSWSPAACVVGELVVAEAVEAESDPHAARIAMLAVPRPPLTRRRRRVQRDGWVIRANGTRVIVGVIVS